MRELTYFELWQLEKYKTIIYEYNFLWEEDDIYVDIKEPINEEYDKTYH